MCMSYQSVALFELRAPFKNYLQGIREQCYLRLELGLCLAPDNFRGVSAIAAVLSLITAVLLVIAVTKH